MLVPGYMTMGDTGMGDMAEGKKGEIIQCSAGAGDEIFPWRKRAPGSRPPTSELKGLSKRLVR